jgi:hypothetical protein
VEGLGIDGLARQFVLRIAGGIASLTRLVAGAARVEVEGEGEGEVDADVWEDVRFRGLAAAEKNAVWTCACLQMGSFSFEGRGQTRRRPGPAAAFVKMLGFIVLLHEQICGRVFVCFDSTG